MRLLQCCMLGVTILLLVCEVTISQLCHSLITLVDSFHTLFILIHVALTSQSDSRNPPLSFLDSPMSPPCEVLDNPAELSLKPLPGTQATADGSIHLNRPATPPAFGCGLSYASCRVQAVGGFLSALILVSLCISGFIEIINLFLWPKPVQHPLLLVVVCTSSLLHKMLMLWLNWDQEQILETKSPPKLNRKVSADDGAKGQAQPGRVLYDVNQVQSATDDSFHNGSLVLCNPGTASLTDTDFQVPESQAEVQLCAAAPKDGRDGEITSSSADLSQSRDVTENIEYLGSQNASNISPVCTSPHDTEGPVPTSQWLDCLRSFMLVTQGLGSAILALLNILVMLHSPQCLHSSDACSLLVYLEPGLSLLAVIMLIATAMPQVCRYGLLLLQATPPNIYISDLEQRIKSVPGVVAVYNLHIWQLTESILVASVHVHCHADFQTHRCAHLMIGVTEVLQSVGVNCCTVQPEFASCSGSCPCDASPVIQRDEPTLPCRLACTKACAGSVCCSPSEEETTLAPPAGETKKAHQTLVMENTFLKKNK